MIFRRPAAAPEPLVDAGRRRNMVVTTKQVRGAQPEEQARPRMRSPQHDPNRRTVRKEVPPPSRGPSMFPYVAPLLRATTALPTKSTPLVPPFLEAHLAKDREKEEKDAERGLRISTPRKSLPSMSVQRRIAPASAQRKGKALQKPSIAGRNTLAAVLIPPGAIPDARYYVGKGMKVVSGSDEEKSSPSESSSEDERDRYASRVF